MDECGAYLKTLIIISLLVLITACASSEVQRSAATDVDTAVAKSNQFFNNATDNNLEDAFQNSTQTTRGVVIGAATGAIAGGIAGSGAGFVPGITGGAVFGGIIGAYIDRHTNLRDQLENRGVNIIVLGDQLKLTLPSSDLFVGMTPTIRQQSRSTLDMIADLLRGITTESIQVAGYTNDTGNPQINCTISQQQADAVVKYLFPRVNSRVVTGMGYGGSHLIARNNLNWGQGANYRIEITTERLPT